MSELAVLGLKIESVGLKEGLTNLEKLAPAAAKAEQATDKMAKSTTTSFAVMTQRLDQAEHVMMQVNRASTVMDSGFMKVTGTMRGLDTVVAKASIDMKGLNGSALASATALAAEARAADEAAAALRNHNAAAAAAPRGAPAGGNMNTANIAAQFQDIAVSAQMGMSPLQIALQQGTQLSAALGNQGLKGTVTALGAAFASVISPVSLLTIGVVALGTAGVQWLMNMNSEAHGVEESLKRHDEWLDKILRGYDDARDAADKYTQDALKLPQGAVQSDITAKAEESLERYQQKLAAVKNEQTAFLQGYIDAYANSMERDPAMKMAEELQNLQAQLNLSNPDLDGLITRLTEIKNSDAYEMIRTIAERMLNLALEAKGAKGEVDGLNASLNNLPDSVMVKLQLQMDNYMEARGDLLDLMPDFRDRFARMRDDAEAAYNRQIGSATDEILRIKAREDYSSVLAGIDRLQQEEAARKAASAGPSAGDKWNTAQANYQQQIDQLHLQTKAIGQSAFEADKARATFELMNQAQAAGIPITTSVTDRISAMAESYAYASAELERTAAAQRTLDEQIAFARGTFQGFFSDLKAGLTDGTVGWDDLGNAGVNALNKIADRAMSMAVDGIFNMLLGAVGLGGPAGPVFGTTRTLNIGSTK